MNYNKIHPYHKQYHQQFSPTVDTDGHTHIPTIQRTRIISDKRLVNCLAKIIVRTAKTAVQDSGQCRFRITGIRTGMHPSVMGHKLQERKTTGNQYHQQGGQSGRKVIATSVERNSIRSWRKRQWSGLNGSGRGLRAIRSTC